MAHTTRSLNGDFGICIENVRPDDLADPSFQARAYDLWLEHGGLLAVRGEALSTLSPEQLVNWSEAFGVIEEITQSGRSATIASMRFFPAAGKKSTSSRIAFSALSRRPVFDMEINHCGVFLKINGAFDRQLCG